MDVGEAIESRRSIRKYLDKPISDELITSVIDSARLAPSGCNSQSFRYLVVNDSKLKQKLKDNDLIRDTWVYEAPVILVCCADPEAFPEPVEGWDDSNESRANRDLSISSAYLVLRAHELGLGTCYCGWIKHEKIKEVLGLPKHYVVPYVIALGYAADTPAAPPKRPIEDIVL